ncbi:methionyl-tRNA formyltransferase [soil metagenome]
MRLAFLGTSEHAATILRDLVATGHRPELVIAPVDRAKGRGRKVSPPPVAALANELDLALHQSENVNRDDTRTVIAEAGVELGMVCAFGQLIGEEMLAAVPMLNVHPSLLPRWRGAAPIERAIMAGDAVTGVSIMRLTEGLDSGPVAFQQKLEIAADEDFGSLDRRLAELGASLAANALDAYESGSISFSEQDQSGVTYAEKIDRAERLLDPARPAPELALVIRGLTPHVGAQLELDGGERLGVRSANAIDEGPDEAMLEADDDALVLGCGDGALRITRVLPSGGREMTAADFLRGRGLPRLAERR